MLEPGWESATGSSAPILCLGRGPKCQVPGFLEAASGDVVLSLGPVVLLLCSSPCLGLSVTPTHCCPRVSWGQPLMAGQRPTVSGVGFPWAGAVEQHACSSWGGSLAVGGTRASIRRWAGGFTAVATGQGPCVPWGLTIPRPSVEVLDRPGMGTAVAAAWRAPGRGQERGREGLGTGFAMFISPLAPMSLSHPPKYPGLPPDLPASGGARACVWPCLTCLSLAAWNGGCSQQRPGCAGVHLGLPALSLTPFPGAPQGCSGRLGTAPSAALILRPSRPEQSRPLNARVKGPVQEACLGRVGWQVPLAVGCPCPSRNAGFVSRRPSWLGAAGR